jgi:hypothetical protein
MFFMETFGVRRKSRWVRVEMRKNLAAVRLFSVA